MGGRNATTGELFADPERFPRGIAHLAAYAHARGLLLGIYTDVTSNPCVHGQYQRESEKVPGSFGHYDTDAKTFASWGVDYVKADFCNGSHDVGTGADKKLVFTVDPKSAYTNFSAALNRTGRPMYFVACFDRWLPQGGSSTPSYAPPWMWMHPIANAYRLSKDHHDNWPQLSFEIATNAHAAAMSVPGSFGDWDYLTTGGEGCLAPGVNPTPPVGAAGGGAAGVRCANMTQHEYRTAVSLWIIGASPLIIDADIRNLSAFQRETLLHEEVLALHQDPRAAGGSRIGCAELAGTNQHEGGHTAEACEAEVWLKPLAGNESLVALFNLGSSARTLRLPFVVLGYNTTTKLRLRDVWNRQELGVYSGSYDTTTTPVQEHETVLLRVALNTDDNAA